MKSDDVLVSRMRDEFGTPDSPGPVRPERSHDWSDIVARSRRQSRARRVSLISAAAAVVIVVGVASALTFGVDRRDEVSVASTGTEEGGTPAAPPRTALSSTTASPLPDQSPVSSSQPPASSATDMTAPSSIPPLTSVPDSEVPPTTTPTTLSTPPSDAPHLPGPGDGLEYGFVVVPAGSVDPTASSIAVLVGYRGCAPLLQAGDVREPVVRISSNAIVIGIPVVPPPLADDVEYTCSRNSSVQLRVELGEAIGARWIFDGSGDQPTPVARP